VDDTGGQHPSVAFGGAGTSMFVPPKFRVQMWVILIMLMCETFFSAPCLSIGLIILLSAF